MKLLAIIPARGGSKGLPRKNLRLLRGKPLMVYTIEAARASDLKPRIVVSTDDEEIAQVAREAGAEVPFLRPAYLAQDDTPLVPVLRHALDCLKEQDKYCPDLVMVLQPTSPLRRTEHIDGAVRLLLETGTDSVLGLCRVHHSPYWMRMVDSDGRVRPFLEGVPDSHRRQDLPEIYLINGAMYLTRPAIILEQDRLLGDDTRAFIMNVEDSIDVDTELDLWTAEAVLAHRQMMNASRNAL